MTKVYAIPSFFPFHLGNVYNIYCFVQRGIQLKKSRKTLKRANQNVSVDQVISNRILILTLTIVVCFLVIFLRLFYLQIISYNDYTAKREDYTSIKQYTSAPRGQIYDCKGRILAKTVVSHNIVLLHPIILMKMIMNFMPSVL